MDPVILVVAEQNALLSAFNDYAKALLASYRIADVLHRLADQTVEVLGVDGAGVSLAQGERLVFVAATDASIAVVEAAQEASRQGPCHDAYGTGELVTADDLAPTRRSTSSATMLETRTRLLDVCRRIVDTAMAPS